MSQGTLRQYLPARKPLVCARAASVKLQEQVQRPLKKARIFYGLPTSDDILDKNQQSTLNSQPLSTSNDSLDGQQLDNDAGLSWNTSSRSHGQLDVNVDAVSSPSMAKARVLVDQIVARKIEQASGTIAIKVLEQEARLSPSKPRPTLLALPKSPTSPLNLLLKSGKSYTASPSSPASSKISNLLSRIKEQRNLDLTSVNATPLPPLLQSSTPEKSTETEEESLLYDLPHLRSLQQSTPTKLRTGKATTNQDKFTPSRHLILPLQKTKLPESFETLDQLFNALEYTLLFMTSRDQTAIFHKIRKSVENVCERTFELKNLRQIKSLFPEAYYYHAVEAVVHGTKINSTAIEFNYNWQLTTVERSTITIETNVVDSNNSSSNVQQLDTLSCGTKRKLNMLDDQQSNDNHAFRYASFAASDMQKRSRIFRQRLIDITADAHEEYLKLHKINWTRESNHPCNHDDSLSTVTGRLTQQWHPEFDLNSLPSIPECELPRLESAVNIAQRLLKQPVKKLQIPHKSDMITQQDKDQKLSSPLKSTIITEIDSEGKSDSVQKLSKISSLLERIREKEKLRSADPLLNLTPEQLKKKSMLGRMPTIVSFMIFLYTSTGKTVLPLNDIARRISESYRTPLSEADASEHVVYVSQIVPLWCQVSDIAGKKYVKMNKTMKEEEILKTLSCIEP